MSIHTGHRARLKQEFLARGFDGWPDHKVVELLLCYAIPQGDLNPLAHRLIDRFGDLAGVLDATPAALMEVSGVGEHTALFLKMLPQIFGRYLGQIEGVEETADNVRDYSRLFAPYFMGATHERCCLLCLDSRGKPLGVDVVGEGEVDRVPFSERKVMECALARRAVGVVLAHNHVGAYAVPSDADKSATYYLKDLLKAVHITLIDHLVICGDEAVSFRESGLLEL